MQSEQQIEIIVETLVPLFNYLEREVILDIAERISGTMAYTRTAELKAISMRALGYSPAKIRKECMRLLNADEKYRKAVAKNTLEHKREVRRLLNEIWREAEKESGEALKDAADTSYLNDLSIWKAAGMELTDDSFLPQLVRAFEKQTRAEFKNLSRTTAFKSANGYETIENVYKRELDKAMIKVCSGTFSKEEVIRDTIHNLAASGLRTVKFESGYSMNLDTAVRNAVRTGVHQMQAKMMDENIRRTGVEYVYVSKHWGARDKGTGHANHEAWQGKVYAVAAGDHAGEAKRIGYHTIEELYEATGYSADGSRENDPLGLHGYNCRHTHRPWFAGISNLSDFPEDPEPAPVTIGGKTYDYYAVTQKMRRMERGIRALKKEREALRAMELDTKEIDYKIRRRTEAYKDFCKAAKVKEKTERLRYECSTENLRRSKAWQEMEKGQEEVTKAGKHDKLYTTKEEKGIEVHTIGKIDRDIYKCVTKDIVTDEVIITDERIAHIQERHPNDYERYYKCLKEIVEHPQYIVETNKPYTALILKEFVDGEEKFKTVMRLTTSHDNPEFKNSIITFMKINDKEWKRILKNKRILYKTE